MSIQSPERPLTTPDEQSTHYWPSLAEINRIVDAEIVPDDAEELTGPHATPEAPEAPQAYDADKLNRNIGQIAAIVDAAEQKIVPRSAASAEEVVSRLHKLEDRTAQSIRENPSLQQAVVEDDAALNVLESLHNVAEKGLDNWRLTKHERAEWAEIAGMTGPNRLDHKWRTYMNDLSAEGGNETERQKFARLQQQAKDRLRLDDELQQLDHMPEDEYVGRHRAETAGKAGAHRPESTAERTHRGAKPLEPIKHPVAPENTGSLPQTADIPFKTEFILKQNQPDTAKAVDPAAETSADDIEALVDERWLAIPESARGMVDAAARERVRAQIRDEVLREQQLDRNCPAELKQHGWDKLDLAAKERVYNRWLELQAEAAKQVSTDNEAAKPETAADPDKTPNKTSAKTRAEARAKRSRWSRVRNLLHRIAPVTSEQKDGQRQVTIHRRRVAALAGVVLVAGSIFAGGHSTEDAPRSDVAAATTFAHDAANQAAGVAGRVAEGLQTAAEAHAKAAKDKAKQAAAAKQAVKRTVVFKPGDTIWHTAEMQLKAKGNAHPTDKQIVALKDRLLKINGQTERSATHLPVGFKLKV